MTPLGHIAVKGLGSLGNGALHPFVTPPHVIGIIALGLLFGQRIPFRLKKPMAALALGSAAGLLATLSGWPGSVPPALILGCALAIAGWTTLDRTAPVAALVAAGALAGSLIGLDSAPEAADPMGISQSMVGTWLGINAAVGYLALCISYSKNRPWARIAIRIAASWIIAITLLVLAFSLRQQVAAGPLRKEPTALRPPHITNPVSKSSVRPHRKFIPPR
ncbi:MAG: hypothetical protein H7A49_02680 [Akkermansiaceae bacterium]|nr:hypothetical protein [Akkermansiaceae bacterium]